MTKEEKIIADMLNNYIWMIALVATYRKGTTSLSECEKLAEYIHDPAIKLIKENTKILSKYGIDIMDKDPF